jgi:hypothetical protein
MEEFEKLVTELLAVIDDIRRSPYSEEVKLSVLRGFLLNFGGFTGHE